MGRASLETGFDSVQQVYLAADRDRCVPCARTLISPEFQRKQLVLSLADFMSDLKRVCCVQLVGLLLNLSAVRFVNLSISLLHGQAGHSRSQQCCVQKTVQISSPKIHMTSHKFPRVMTPVHGTHLHIPNSSCLPAQLSSAPPSDGKQATQMSTQSAKWLLHKSHGIYTKKTQGCVGCGKINDVQDRFGTKTRPLCVRTVDHLAVTATYCQRDRTISICNISLFYFESFTAVWAHSKFSKYITLNIIFLNFSDVSWFRILSAVFAALRVGGR
jgi:hypothetical protein